MSQTTAEKQLLTRRHLVLSALPAARILKPVAPRPSKVKAAAARTAFAVAFLGKFPDFSVSWLTYAALAAG
jgi:hypothetical protein